MNKINSILKPIALLFLAVFVLSSCEKEDPVIPNEEEVITTLTYTLTPVGGGDVVTFYFQDLDGDGGNNPIITSKPLKANTTYNGSIVLLNETETPAEDITDEVKDEDEDHQFFYNAGSNAQITYKDEDEDGNPVGILTSLSTGESSTGTLTIVLRHEPLKPNDGTLTDAGGETDIEVEFDLVIQ